MCRGLCPIVVRRIVDKDRIMDGIITIHTSGKINLIVMCKGISCKKTIRKGGIEIFPLVLHRRVHIHLFVWVIKSSIIKRSPTKVVNFPIECYRMTEPSSGCFRKRCDVRPGVIREVIDIFMAIVPVVATQSADQVCLVLQNSGSGENRLNRDIGNPVPLIGVRRIHPCCIFVICRMPRIVFIIITVVMSPAKIVYLVVMACYRTITKNPISTVGIIAVVPSGYRQTVQRRNPLACFERQILPGHTGNHSCRMITAPCNRGNFL